MVRDTDIAVVTMKHS